MKYNLYYNEKKYIDSLKKGDIMQLDGIMKSHKKAIKYEVSPNVSEYISYTKNKPFYISPSFTDVKTDLRTSTKNPKIIIFSAPGATGKTSLAKYISYEYDALYWDLSKNKVGDNFFSGSILEAVSPPKYSNFISDLNTGNVLLAIDALDEAETISGRKMLGRFIQDINKSLDNPSIPTVLLFSRTETAQFLASLCTENTIPVIHYEIGFFNESSSIEFIVKSISNMTPTEPDIQCSQKYYDFIKNSITENERSSFLGYAPVLQAISTHIKAYPNRQKLISELSSQTDCVSVILQIMDDLLEREQNEKMLPALKSRLSELYPDFTEWERIYTHKEQLVRIINYILFNDTNYSNYPLGFIPSQFVDEYQKMLESFLKQHPFVKNGFEDGKTLGIIDFTGPAFRDYVLAKIILDEETKEYADLYLENMNSELYSPSQIFFDCYMKLSETGVSSEYISYVFDSFKAKATAYESAFLHCYEKEVANDEKEIDVIFDMIPGKGKTKRIDSVESKLKVERNTLHFEQVVNVSVDTPSLDITIGHSDKCSRFSNSSIVCNSIVWNTSNITIESYSPGECLLVSKNEMLGNPSNVEINRDDNLKVSAPNISSYYRLIPYKYNFEDSSSEVDITRFIYALRCILFQFRTHKKDTLAKTADRIDYVIVGSSELKKCVLEFLKSKRIIYTSEHLYKVDEAEMQKIGINFNALLNVDTESLKKAFSEFNEFIKTE